MYIIWSNYVHVCNNITTYYNLYRPGASKFWLVRLGGMVGDAEACSTKSFVRPIRHCNIPTDIRIHLYNEVKVAVHIILSQSKQNCDHTVDDLIPY